MEYRKHCILKSILICFIILLFSNSLASDQVDKTKWKLNSGFANMKPLFKLDRWFVTPEGYHIHPACEDFMPGIHLGVEQNIYKNISLEYGILYGYAPAFLGIVDQFSASGRESNTTERHHFISLLISPKLYLNGINSSGPYISAVTGLGMISEKTIVPSFGPAVTWEKRTKAVYGIKIGLNIRLKNEKLFFNSEIFLLSMKSHLEEKLSGRTLDETIGPFGLLFGISYILDRERHHNP